MHVVAGDADQAGPRSPGAPVALGDQLVAATEAKVEAVCVREKPVHTAACVIAHLEHRVDAVLRQVPDIPVLEPPAGRERIRGDVRRDSRSRGCRARRPPWPRRQGALRRQLRPPLRSAASPSPSTQDTQRQSPVPGTAARCPPCPRSARRAWRKHRKSGLLRQAAAEGREPLVPGGADRDHPLDGVLERRRGHLVARLAPGARRAQQAGVRQRRRAASRPPDA